MRYAPFLLFNAVHCHHKGQFFIFIDNIHHKNKDVNKTCFFVNAVLSRLFTVDILISRFI